MKVRIDVEGRAYEAVVDRKKRTVTIDGESFPLDGSGVRLLGPGRARLGEREVTYAIREVRVGATAAGEGASGAKVKAPMTGKLESVRVAVGQAVQKGDVLFVLEAMKMQNEVRSPAAGKVTVIHAKPGATLQPGAVVLELA